MAGREVVENGLPSRDELTVYGLGNTWTDQQWLAQIFIYGTYSLGGHALLSIATAALVVLAFAIATAAARSLGAGPRAIWVLLCPCSWPHPGPGRSAPRCSRFPPTGCSGSSRRGSTPDEASGSPSGCSSSGRTCTERLARRCS
jgi:hypothetical protein